MISLTSFCCLYCQILTYFTSFSSAPIVNFKQPNICCKTDGPLFITRWKFLKTHRDIPFTEILFCKGLRPWLVGLQLLIFINLPQNNSAIAVFLGIIRFISELLQKMHNKKSISSKETNHRCSVEQIIESICEIYKKQHASFFNKVEDEDFCENI